MRATWAESLTSVETATARRPNPSTSAAASSMGACLLPAMTRSAPALARARTIARPKPVPPPVTTMDLPSRLSLSSILGTAYQLSFGLHNGESLRY